MQKSQLCSVLELQNLIDVSAAKVLDCSWYLPSQKKDTKSEFSKQHIPSAQFFYIDDVCDKSLDLPHMLPSADEFAQAVSELGISNDDSIVVYDSSGLFSAARVWWMFKVFGHASIRVLDGGLPAWLHAEANISNTHVPPQTTSYKATYSPGLVSSKSELQARGQCQQSIVLDARSQQRFLGKAPEPRPGLPSGHMPNSQSLPYTRLIHKGRLKPKEELLKIFNDMKIDHTSEVVTSCGSGVTAAIITLALAECGFGMQRLYDGSWAEWGSADDTVILNRSTT